MTSYRSRLPDQRVEAARAAGYDGPECHPEDSDTTELRTSPAAAARPSWRVAMVAGPGVEPGGPLL
jgi:hypothetical protein